MIFLTAGYMKVPAGLFRPGGGWSWTVIPMTVAVIRREDGRYVLVDCGFSRAEIEDPAAAFGVVRQYAFRLDRRRDPPRAVVDQLADRGIDPADVAAIVPTHLHLDHVGGFADFPNAEIVAREDELASGRRRGRNHGFIHLKGLDASGRARAVQLREEDRHGFPGHLDLFGDGRVVLLDARGHTAGSVAVLLTDPESGRSALMAGDAAYHPDELRTGRISLLARYTTFQKEWLRATWGRLRDFQSAHPETPVVLAHDLDCFRHLPH